MYIIKVLMGVKKEGEKLMRVNGHNLLNLGEDECGKGKVEKEVSDERRDGDRERGEKNTENRREREPRRILISNMKS